ncbi:MAG: hypothetical protein IT370_32585 [Deltaproteobacteria bacterium]|nr:hypothetical protein [Deltaproteobacteria bacterium]
MIHFDRVPEPAGFAAEVERPGADWLAANPGAARPRSLWGPFTGALAEGFRHLCGYSAMWVPSSGTVDHFVSWNEDRSLAYRWANYRFAASWLNSSKQRLRAEQVLDPFEVADGWFEIILPSLQLVVTDTIPAAARDRAAFVLKRLHLAHDERIIRQRREWYRMYQAGELTLGGLALKAPLIAAAVRKQLAVR